MFAISIHFRLSLKYLGKARAYQIGASYSTLMVGSCICPQILDKGESEQKWQMLWLIDTAIITAVKSFIVPTQSVHLFSI